MSALPNNLSINQVAVKMPGGFNVVSLKEFLNYDVTLINYLLLKKNLQFLDVAGEEIPYKDALQELASIIRKKTAEIRQRLKD